MDSWVVLGLFAGLLTTVGFVPQIIKGYQTKRMNDISLVMPIMLSLGMVLWFFYGLVLGDIPIMFWNAIALILNLIVIALVLRYRK